jgi:hypothetical protein
VTGRFSLENLD